MAGPEKAYKNLGFLNSPAARTIRILCEYEEPEKRFREQKVRDTIVFYGSARSRPPLVAADMLAHAQRELASAQDPAQKAHLENLVRAAERRVHLSQYYDQCVELARRLTQWDLERKGRRRYLVCTGGGPGMMEAANRGAAEVEGGRSVGLGISLPFEEKVNPFVSPDLGFEFHYFFMRKYWFMYLAKAFVLMPGGFGTMDELFEMLTLRQTGKVTKRLPTVLFGAQFWNEVLNFEALLNWGVISEKDLLLFHRTDSVDDAFEFITSQLEAIEHEEEARQAPHGESR
jgi:uncharacterized protein (TIGR00730 family)